MPKPKKMGRPPLPAMQKLKAIYCARFRPDEERDIIRAFEASGKTASDWMRETLLAAARSPKD